MSDGAKGKEALPGKRLALFLDGSWNTVTDNTNVWRLNALCAPKDADGVEQIAYYDTGVGTVFGEKFRGGMLGFGLSKNIIQAYEWLMGHYDLGDHVFIFGFSRGAYTARSLAGFIALCGLLKPGAPLGIGQLYRRYQQAEGLRTIWKLVDERNQGTLKDCSLEETWMLKYSMPIETKVVAVWDTVGSLGIPGFSRSRYHFLHTGLRLSIQHAFHAMAIDEHRQAFSPTLWTKLDRPNRKNAPMRPLEKAEQRWFVGSHANVGGGYPSDLLAQIPLRWIMKKAADHGLKFRDKVVIDGDVHDAKIPDSFGEFLYGAYSVAKLGARHYRLIGESARDIALGTERNFNETIDASVFERWRANQCYRPFNLVRWANRNKVDPSTIMSSVRADDPKYVVPD